MLAKLLWGVLIIGLLVWISQVILSRMEYRACVTASPEYARTLHCYEDGILK